MSELNTGVIGLGAMGGPMARHLAAAGLLSMVWNRTRARADALSQELGVPVAENAEALAAVCNVVLVCVSADEDLVEVLDACRPALSAGDTVIDTSTVSPTLTRRLAASFAAEGVGYVDAPVSGGVEGARKGTLSVMAGGDSADLSRIAPILEAISARRTHMGEAGSGQATKAVNQVMVAGINEAVCEALALGEKLNLPSERLIEVLSAGAAGNWFLDHRGKTMLADQFEPGFKSGLMLKDLRICETLARELDISLPTVEAAVADYAALVDAGGFDDDTSALIRLKRRTRTERD
ncbi:MAG: NAD(P)-dependent oxidoreductase [Pseudomonadota bacterium]